MLTRITLAICIFNQLIFFTVKSDLLRFTIILLLRL
jgi:hypothetical protein